MKNIIYLALIIVFASCTHSNTDTTVVENANPRMHTFDFDTIPPSIDTFIFNKLAFDCFFDLGKATEGTFNYKMAGESVYKTIIDVIQNHATDGADIAIIIDKTGSMYDDIDNVKKNMNLIIDQISQFKNIRLCAATYGDKNVDGSEWYTHSDISEDYSITRNYINKVNVTGGGDYPESVYDGLALLIKDTKWRKEAKKIILVIGDAPSLEGSLSDHSRKEIIDLCTQEGIHANIFPVLVTPYSIKMLDEVAKNPYMEKFIQKVFPNPASEYIDIELKKESDYTISLLDINGKLATAQNLKGSSLHLNIPEDIRPGSYIVRVIDNKSSNFNTENITIVK